MPQDDKKHISTTTGLLIILAAAVIIGGGAIAYFYAMSPTSWDFMGNRASVHKTSNTNTNTSNTNSTTADWKTYTDTLGKYSIKYPKDYTATAGNEGAGVYFTNTANNKITLAGLVSGGDYDSRKGTLSQWYTISNETSDTINGNKIKIFTATSKGNGGNDMEGIHYFIYDSNNQALYEMYSVSSLQSVMENILSTFQFTQ